MSVRTVVMSDTMQTKQQRLVTNVMILVHAVKLLELIHVLVVMETVVYTKRHVLTLALIIITIKITFVLIVMLLVKLVMVEPNSIVFLVMKPLIYKMENV
jgi:hypothetical protein